MSGAAEVATIAAALASGLVGGVFFAFSTFVMGALRRLPAEQGAAAMQSINVVVLTPLFMIPLFGNGLLCLVLIVWAAVSPDDFREGLVIAGSALYFVGTVGVTMLGNVPMNNRLERMDPKSPEAASYWREYATGWTAWNHVRTIAALAAAALLTVAVAT